MARGFAAIRDNPLAFLEDTRRRYGALVAFPVPRTTALLVSDPADVRRVLQSGARTWTKATVQYAALARVTGPGLLAVADERWLPRRRIAQPAFHHARLDAVSESIRAAAGRVVGEWQSLPADGAVLDVDALAMRVTLDVIGRTLFDEDLAEVTDALVHATDEAAELVVAQGRQVVPLPSWVPTPVNRRLRRAVHDLDRICREVIARRRSRGVGESHHDLLGLLLAAGLPDDAVRDELVTMVVAGHETVASALTWTLMLLAEHPSHQELLRAEVRAAGDVPALQLRRELRGTRAVVDESLRLFPPGWVVSRRATAPDVLGGREVPAGTIAIVSPWLLHRDPAAWPDPENFDPGRFDPDRFAAGQAGSTLSGSTVSGNPASGAATTTARADYLPFGLGPRLCIGRDFSLVELTVLLAELLRDHAVSLPRGWRRPEVDAFVTLRPRGGLRLRVTPCVTGAADRSQADVIGRPAAAHAANPPTMSVARWT
ncbi:MAG: cytochrome P450, partial [Oryzihumus sp.]